jgi:predicted molibdopterin-dependent oxidoreductase YjgC
LPFHRETPARPIHQKAHAFGGTGHRADQREVLPGFPNPTILNAYRFVKITILMLCYHSDRPLAAKCGVCAARIDANTDVCASMQPVWAGMMIGTMSPELLSKGRGDLPPDSKLQEMCRDLMPKTIICPREAKVTNVLTFGPMTCTKCGRCVQKCAGIQGPGAIKDLNPRIRVNEGISCGQFLTICPTSSLSEKSSQESVLRGLVSGTIMIIELAPFVRAAVGE